MREKREQRKMGEVEAGLGSQIGLAPVRTGEVKLHKLLINQAGEWLEQGDE